MKKTQLLDALRNIWKQKVSYLSIIIIALLGVTTYLGLDYAAVALTHAGSDAYTEMNFRDIEIISTLLLTEDNLAQIRSTEGVADAEAVWKTDAKIYAGEERKDVSVTSLTERINLPEVLEGRLPASASECAVEKSLAEDMLLQVGDKIELTSADGDTPDYLTGSSFDIVGIVNHPDHTNPLIGDTPYLLVQKEAFDTEALDGCFMKAEIMIERAPDANRFGSGYDEALDAVCRRLEELAITGADARVAEVRQQYQEKIDDGQAELDSAADELRDARAELDDGWEELRDGEEKLADGQTQLEDAKAQLEDAWQQLLDVEAQLEEAEAELAAAKAQLDSGAAELAAADAQLASARAELIAGWEELEDAKETVRGTIREAVENVLGSEGASMIPWAGRQSADLNGTGASAADFWITDSIRFDVSLSMQEYMERILSSPSIPDEVLIRAYEELIGGGEK